MKEKQEFKEFIERHMSPYNLGDEGRTMVLARKAIERIEYLEEIIDHQSKQLEYGRKYLMECGDSITDSDALEAFGFGRNGYKDR